MSRIGWSEDESFPGQFEIWQANCRRSLRGRKGQAALRELETALVALESKRLIAHALENEDGDVCAIGALVKAKGIAPKADPEWQMEDVGVECGLPRLVAWKVVELNDIHLDGRYVVMEGPTRPTERFRYRGAGGGCGSIFVPLTPEERYTRVLAWVRSELRSGSASADPAVESAGEKGHG